MVLTSTLLVLMLVAPPAPAPTSPDDERVDHLELAALLVRDGHHARAAAELAQLDPDAPDVAGQPPLDRARYWTLRGVVALHEQDHLDAATSFERAWSHGATEPTIPSFIAQSWAALEQWEAALSAFERVPDSLFDAEPRLRMLRANAWWRAGQPAQAHAALRALVAERPELAEAWRLLLYLLAESGLHRAAAEVGTTWLARPGASLDDHLAVAEALRRARALPEAEGVLTQASLRFPDDARVLALSGRTLLDRGQPLAAALLLERASLPTPERALDAAELYRRAGQLERALWVNARVPDAAAKLRQRLGLLVDLGRFEEAAALGERALRLDLQRDDSVVYALAFSCFRVGDHDAAERWLARIGAADYFDRAAGLRKSMAVCAAAPERCP